jgi:hypothetical protein
MCQAVGKVPGSLIDWAAGVVGVPCAVVHAQITDESGGNPAAVSPAGAQGVAQFEPGTWRDTGCAGSPFNVNDAMKCYAKLMYQLVRKYHGNVRDALAAYNAGPGNLPAGYGYADNILRAAGQSPGLQAGAGNPGPVQTPQQTDAQAAEAGPECAFSVGGQHLGILFGHGPSLPSACIVTKTEVRAVMGGLILVGGALVMLPGLVIVMAYGFKATGAAAATLRAAQYVPGGGTAVRAARTAGAAYSRGGPQRPAKGRGRAGDGSGRPGSGQGQGGGQGGGKTPPKPPVTDPSAGV